MVDMGMEKTKQIDEILDFININLNGNIENLIGNIICGDFNEKNIYLNNFEDVSMLSLIHIDAADDLHCVDLGVHRIIKKKNTTSTP